MTYDTAATLFSGGGGADIGLSGAGISVKWGLEYDDDIAQIARDNGLNIHTGDVTEESPEEWPDVDVLHASPPCPNFSVAKTGGEETDEDVSLAEATARFISGIQPKLFTLENVWGYRKSQSWKLIRERLTAEGYDWNAWKLNAADYGVPQTRKRMIVAARRGGPRPKKPTPTHAEESQSGGLFEDDRQEWIGWYEAIEDLIPDLPETELADWQKERLPNELTETLAVGAGGFRDKVVSSQTAHPFFSVTANRNQQNQLRAVLVHAPDTRTCPQREQDTPTFSVISNGNSEGGGANIPRAVLVKGSAIGSDEDIGGNEEDPAGVVKSETGRRDPCRAVLVGNNPNRTSGAKVYKDRAEPAFTQRGGGGGRVERVITQRRVVQMTPRALARFQTFPDSYILPDSKRLACRIIGNAVPPLAMKKWVQHWMQR